MKAGTVGNCAYALQEISKPDIKAVRSALLGSILRLGDVETQADEAIEILVKASKCTSMSRPKSWKKYALREDDSGQSKNDKSVYAPLKMRTEFYVDRTGGNDKDVDGDVKMEEGDVSLHHGSEVKDEDEKKEENLEKVQKEELVKGFKYGTTYVPCPDGQFARLHTKKGIDICGFIDKKNVRFLPLSLFRGFRMFTRELSSAGIGQLETFSIYGPIPHLRNSKSHSHQWYKPCTKKVPWLLLVGCRETVWTRRWVFYPRCPSMESTVCYGLR